jgi:hypothetical protein
MVLERLDQSITEFLGRDLAPTLGGVKFGIVVTPTVVVLFSDLPGG